MALLSLDHVQLAMPEGGEAAARAFYRDLLGLEEREKPAALRSRGGCWFETGAVRLHLGVEVGFRPSAKAHPAFRVAGLDALLERLRAAGAALAAGEHPRQAYVHDPFGNRIELLEEEGGVLPAAGLALATPRLLMRPPEAADFEAYCSLVKDAEAMRFLGGPQGREVAWRGLAAIIGAWSLNGASMFSVFERASGRWVGRCGPWRPEGWPGWEIGYAFLPEVWGRGYASEAAGAALNWGFEERGWEEAIHCIDRENLGSIAVASRLGSELLRSARLPPPLGWDVLVYGQSRERWAARRGQSGRSAF